MERFLYCLVAFSFLGMAADTQKENKISWIHVKNKGSLETVQVLAKNDKKNLLFVVHSSDR